MDGEAVSIEASTNENDVAIAEAEAEAAVEIAEAEAEVAEAAIEAETEIAEIVAETQTEENDRWQELLARTDRLETQHQEILSQLAELKTLATSTAIATEIAAEAIAAEELSLSSPPSQPDEEEGQREAEPAPAKREGRRKIVFV